MNQKDRDRLIELFVFYDFIDDWVKDPNTEIKLDTNKVGKIRQNIKLLMQNYAKKEGYNAVAILLEETSNLDFGFIPKDKEVEFKDTCEHNILRGAIKKVLKNCTQCDMCKRQDYKYCEWYTIHKFLDSEQVNKKKKDCPFRKDISTIFNLDEID